MTVRSGSAEETMRIGALLARGLEAGDAVLLDGPLGSGKTTLVRGLLRELGVTGPVRSPTFNLIHEYTTRPPVAHADLYRLSGGEVGSLGLDELLERCALVLEWPDRAPERMPEEALQVRIDFEGDEARRLAFEAAGPRAHSLLVALEEAVAAGGL